MKRYVALFGTLAAAGCGLEAGAQIEIVNAPPVNRSSCQFQPTLVFQRSTGVFDPTLAESFRLGLTMRNNLADNKFDPVALEGSLNASLRPSANAAKLIGFDTCFYREDDPTLNVSALGTKGRALVDCTSLPVEQQRFVPAALDLPPGGESDRTAEIRVLRSDDLQVLFGQGFVPEALGVVGAAWEDTNGSGTLGDADDDIVYDFRTPSPMRDPTRSPQRNVNWGDYPESRHARVVVQATGQLKLQTGKLASSNEFVFPIELQTGLALDVCDNHAILQQCLGVCGGQVCPSNLGRTLEQQRECVLTTPGQCASECSAGGGSAGKFCRPFGFVGSRPDVTRRCLVAQREEEPNCANWNGCGFQ